MSDAHRILHPSRRARLAAFAVALALLAVSAVVWLSPSTAEPSAAPAKSAQQIALEQENAELKAALAARTDEVDNLTSSQEKAAAERAAQQEAQRATAQAEVAAEQEVQRAEAQERVDVRAAASDATEAVDEHRAAVDDAAAARAAADEARERAAKLTDNADLP